MAYLIVGYLSETVQAIRDTVTFAKKLAPDYAIFAPAYPFPETKLFNDAAIERLVDPEYSREFVLGKRTDAIAFLFPGASDGVAKACRSFLFRAGVYR